MSRSTQRNPPTPTQARAVLYPAIAEAARRVSANAVGLIDVGCGAGFDLTVDRVGLTYRNGPPLGDPHSPVQLSSAIVGRHPAPARAMPQVRTRIGIDSDPIDVTDPAVAGWLRDCVPPDRPDLLARLAADIALTTAITPLLRRGDPIDLLPDAIARVPADTLPVVTTSWALSRFPRDRRQRFLHRLDESAAGRVIAWVSAEGVGVAPAIPTLGDRHASGHSILGLAIFDGAALRAEAIGRCWSRGRMLSWLTGT
ncbi:MULTISPECIES: DUF2332 domain-containing protein [Nocardia]|uniref:DUF2332 domain-containing protein n=1 Tax=Nocardia TaxID=1817 RepID=UPI0018933467|nr:MULTISPECIES: DUF2332 domain-containing protein [Nocardia]MBF6352510.1 DUF2332 domain-containing protein [Nocardia flavorosea]